MRGTHLSCLRLSELRRDLLSGTAVSKKIREEFPSQCNWEPVDNSVVMAYLSSALIFLAVSAACDWRPSALPPREPSLLPEDPLFPSCLLSKLGKPYASCSTPANRLVRVEDKTRVVVLQHSTPFLYGGQHQIPEKRLR